MGRIILIALTVFIYSCVGKTDTKQCNPTNKIKNILLVSRPDSIITKISQIALDIEYIPLHSSGNTRIKVIDKIITRGNKIYINIIDNLLCFDDQGHFLYKLYGNETDKGENVVAIYDFDIDTADTSLIVLYGNKILHFKNTGSGFDYLNTIKLGKLSPSKLDFVPGTNKILLSSFRMKGYEPSLNVLININGDTLSFKRNYFIRFNPVKNRIWDNIIHYQFDNKLYLRERFNDTVFSIDYESNKFTPEYILDSHMSSTNPENINDPGYFRILPNVVKIFEIPRYIYYTYKIGHLDRKVFYDKYKDRKYQIDQRNGILIDDIGGGPDFDPKYFCEGKMYSWIRVRDLKEYLESRDFTEVQVQNTQKQDNLKKLVLPNYTEKSSFIICPGEHRFPRSFLTPKQIMQNKYLGLNGIFETRQFFIINYSYLKHYLAFIDKHNHKVFLNHYEYDNSNGYFESGLVNDLDGGSWFLPKSYFSDDGREYLVGIQYPYQIMARIISDDLWNSISKYPEKRNELKKLAASLEETDNPILIIVRLKK